MSLVLIRRTTQILILGSIIAIMLFNSELALEYLPWLSRFSPLMTIVTRIAQKAWSPYFCGGIIVAFICLFYPRLFCGWICPLGTCIDITDKITFAHKRDKYSGSPWWVALLILMCLLTLAVLGSEAAGYLDPMTITGNSFFTFTEGDIIAKITNSLKEKRLDPDLILPLIFIGILLLAIFGRRTWCRIFCPLGGLLGIISTIAIGRREVNDTCINCGKCAKVCKMKAIKKDVKKTITPGCIYCESCSEVCPKGSISFSQT